MTDYPPPPTAPALTTDLPRRPFYRDSRLAWLVVIAALIAIGVVRQRPDTAQPASQRDGQRAGTASSSGSSGQVASRTPSSPASTARSTATASTSLTPTASAAPSVASTIPAPEQPEDFLFTMPDLTGVSLQKAQNTVQGLGVFFSRSHDLRGSRRQVIDSNWKVCDQNITPGTAVTGKARDLEGKIDFGVVKDSEGCP